MKEVKAKIRTLRCELERGPSRTVPENHDTVASLVVQHAAATICWHRIGPFQRRKGKSSRRVVCTFRAECHVDGDRQSCESKVQTSNAVGTPDGGEAARAIKFEPDESDWEVELLLSVQTTTMGSHATRPERSGSACGPRRVYIRGNVEFWKYGQSLGYKGCVLQSPQRRIDPSLTAANAGNEWKAQCATTPLEPDVLKNPRDGKVK